MEIFNVNDKVVITSSEHYIKGIYNHNTIESNRDIFNTEIVSDKFFGNEIIGIIKMIGKYNFYLIESIDNHLYIYCNDYHGMIKGYLSETIYNFYI